MQGDIELPAVTIVIANHNYGRWLEGCITSALHDPYPRKQIMVVDDGSTDESWAVLSKIANFSSNAQSPKEGTVYPGSSLGTPIFGLKFQQAGGPSKARNAGIQAMWETTHLYGFLDTDDLYMPGKISKSVRKFLGDPEHIGAIYTDYDTLDIDTGRKVRVYKEPFDRDKLLQNCIVHSSCIVNKYALNVCGVYDNEMRTCEDYDLWMRISEKFVLLHIPESLMLVRVGSHNSTSTVQQAVWEKNYRRVFEKLMARQNGK
jgi:glycosyltransferase involved in cell wall biosynthesis